VGFLFILNETIVSAGCKSKTKTFSSISPSSTPVLPVSPHHFQVSNFTVNFNIQYQLEDEIDRRIKSFFKEHQTDLIQWVCKIDNKSPETIRTLLNSLKNEKVAYRNMRCLRKLGKLWNDPETIINLFTEFINDDGLISRFLKTSQLNIGKLFLTSNYIKNIRYKISIEYFKNIFYSRLGNYLNSKTKNLNISLIDLETSVIIIGFHRIFFEAALVTSPASDIDINLIYDDAFFQLYYPQLLKTHQDSTLFKIETLSLLKRIAKEFSTYLGMILEVEDFTVRSLSELQTFFTSQNENNLNFLSSIANHNILIHGNSGLYQRFQSLITDFLSPEEIRERAFRQHFSSKTSKGSIGLIIKVGKIRERRSRSTETLTREDVLILDKGDRVFSSYPIIGMSEVTELTHKANWAFSLKYSMIRLFDLDPTLPHARTMSELGIYLEYLLIKTLKNLGMSEDAAFQQYDTLFAQQFYQILQHYHSETMDIIYQSCAAQLVNPPLCERIYTNLDPENLTESRAHLFGFRYFKDLFDSAVGMSHEYASDVLSLRACSHCGHGLSKRRHTK